uniref:Integrase core domain containing protein n=1 Tax=Solanum tuberosum TaxID=4113 RepID=M1DRY3_SOLTU
MELARLRSYVDALLAPGEVVPKTAPEVEENEVVMSALFGDTMPPPDPSPAGKRHHSSEHTYETDEARRERKRERQELAVAQRQSIVDEELRQHGACEIRVGPSGSRSTTEGVTTIAKGVTDDVPITDPASSWKSDPPTS